MKIIFRLLAGAALTLAATTAAQADNHEALIALARSAAPDLISADATIAFRGEVLVEEPRLDRETRVPEPGLFGVQSERGQHLLRVPDQQDNLLTLEVGLGMPISRVVPEVVVVAKQDGGDGRVDTVEIVKPKQVSLSQSVLELVEA